MDRQKAINTVWGRMRDFAHWSGFQGQAPSWEEREEKIVEMATICRQQFPRIKKNDLPSWEIGGYKRDELDEAFRVLGLEPLE